jgi:uncharacterized protein with von Willebrand factor type A (vWA) domain
MRPLDAPFDRLESLPRELWLPGLVTAVGETGQRLLDLHTWLAALERGELPPPPAHFGDAVALAPMREAVATLDLPALCRGTPALAQQVMRTLLWHLDRIADQQPRLTRAAAIAAAAQAFTDEWLLQKSGWEEVLALMQGLGELAHLSWDELRGVLRSREWQEAQRISAMLAHLRPLAELIRALGRSQHDAGCPPAPNPTLQAQPERAPQRERETRLPEAPGEVTGIRHSDRIERMLGSEAAQIRHPVLHKLWRARLAESRLLTYESEAVLQDRVPDPTARSRASVAATQTEPLSRGPIILCIDTSGSMKGAPETIAKAVALEALRVAQREQRACLLVAFGGPGELIERELGANRAGLHALLDLMGQGFDGGTDVQTPIEHAIARVHRERWRSADLLIVSDGEFGCTAATLAQLDTARTELGLRVQGVLVGDRETLGLLEACDHIFWLRDWRRYDGVVPQREGFVPVHSQSLTALYFPNALSERAARRRGAGTAKP